MEQARFESKTALSVTFLRYRAGTRTTDPAPRRRLEVKNHRPMSESARRTARISTLPLDTKGFRVTNTESPSRRDRAAVDPRAESTSKPNGAKFKANTPSVDVGGPVSPIRLRRRLSGNSAINPRTSRFPTTGNESSWPKTASQAPTCGAPCSSAFPAGRQETEPRISVHVIENRIIDVPQ